MTPRILLLTIFIFAARGASGQLCQGSLGDPLVNITFGSGPNPGAPLSAAATGYQFFSADCPNDGSYTVRNSTNSCFGNSWYSLSVDHTGDGNGYFMLVNASIQPSAFYVDTVRGLCGSSTYEFAAWITNVSLPSSCNGNSNQPNLTFRIERTDGTLLQTYNSGNIVPTAAPQWKQYGFFFTTPAAGTDIVLRIINNAPGGCGNDLALDDITFRPCGPQVNPAITGQATRIANVCEGAAVAYDFTAAVSGGFTSPVFQWQQKLASGQWVDIAGANSTAYRATIPAGTTAGSYDYRLSVAEAGNLSSSQCRISSQLLTIVVHPNPTAAATNNGPVCENGRLTLTASGGSQYQWSGPASYSANAAVVTLDPVQPASGGTYNVIVTSVAGCSSTANTVVTVNAAPNAVVAFSDTAVCTGSSVRLLASGGLTYQWTPASGLSSADIAAPLASPLVPTRYQLRVTDGGQCSDTASVNVRVYQKAIANAGPDKTIIGGTTSMLEGSVSGPYSTVAWSPAIDLDDGQVLRPVSSAAVDTRYVLSVNSANNCGVSTDTMFLKIYKDIYIPTAFSPNADGLNDTWSIPALDAYPAGEIFVFDRYGEVVFKSKAGNTTWDGKFKGTALPNGAYPYLVRLPEINKLFKGMLMIVR